MIRALALVLVFACVAGCAQRAAPVATQPAPTKLSPLAPSPNVIVGRIVAIDAERGFAFVELADNVPPVALANGADLTTRKLDLSETARLRASSYVRGKTLGTRILSGQPTPGDEVVWRAP